MKRGAKVIKLKDIVDDALTRASADGHTVGAYLQGRSQGYSVKRLIIVANQRLAEF